MKNTCFCLFVCLIVEQSSLCDNPHSSPDEALMGISICCCFIDLGKRESQEENAVHWWVGEKSQSVYSAELPAAEEGGKPGETKPVSLAWLTCWCGRVCHSKMSLVSSLMWALNCSHVVQVTAGTLEEAAGIDFHIHIQDSTDWYLCHGKCVFFGKLTTFLGVTSAWP